MGAIARVGTAKRLWRASKKTIEYEDDFTKEESEILDADPDLQMMELESQELKQRMIAQVNYVLSKHRKERIDALRS